MNLANKITISRIFLAFAFVGFLFGHGVIYKALALVTFILASLTDVIDGYIAKSRNEMTDFGRLMDPIADKILVLSAFVSFVELRLIPAWMVIIIIFREVAITGLRLFALSQGKVISADGGGKNKTVWQMTSIFLILIFMLLKEPAKDGNSVLSRAGESTFHDIILFVMTITVLFTLASGISYLVKNRGVYANEKKD